MQFIIRLILSAATLMLISYIVPGIHIAGALPAFLSAFFLGIVNALIRPILILFTLPITILTLGLFIFFINTFLFILVASLVDGFDVDGFLPALVGSLLMSIITTYVHSRA